MIGRPLAPILTAAMPAASPAVAQDAESSWLPTLITETPELGFDLAISMARKAVTTELVENSATVERCLDWCHKGPVTLLYAAKDRDHNQAVVLRDYLRERLAREDAT